MKITVLVDNYTIIDKYLLGEPGLSFYIEEDDKKILFDTGYSDIYIKNANKLNIDLNNLDCIVLSHGHNDHTGGLKYLNNINTKNTVLISHPLAFEDKYKDNKLISSPVKLKDLNIKEFIDGTKPIKITENLIFLGQIERKFPYENNTLGTLKDNNEDKLLDDSALVYKVDNGLFIITGCSHSGICNIIEQAKGLFNEDRIIGVIGGFHLREDDYQLYETCLYFVKNRIKNVYPCHCTNLNAKIKLSKIANISEVGVGFTLEI